MTQYAFGTTKTASVNAKGSFTTSFQVPTGTAPGQYQVGYSETTPAGQKATDVENYTVIPTAPIPQPVPTPSGTPAPPVLNTRPNPNACSLSLDKSGTLLLPNIFDFTNACNQHDLCYINHPYGNGPSGRAECDKRFHDDMVKLCAAQHPGTSFVEGARRGSCEAWADSYYTAVRALGWITFYYNPLNI